MNTSEACLPGVMSISLFSPDIPQAMVGVFVSLFEQAWGMIPQTDRVTISDYWQSRSAPAGLENLCVPYREFLPRLWLRAGDGLPYCDYYGHQPVFFPATLAEISREFAVVAIAHEMAHVLLYATRDPHHWTEPLIDGQTKEEAEFAAERRVDEILRSWGLDQTACQAWVAERKARSATAPG